MVDIFSIADNGDPYYNAQSSSSGSGRVGDAAPGTGSVAPFQLFSHSDRGMGSTFAKQTLSHVLTDDHMSPVDALFLSPANVDALQEAIRYRVYVESDGAHVIGRQSETELATVMRSVLLQNRGYEGADPLAQVRALNAEVLAFCVPRVLGEVRQYVRYRQDVSSFPDPMVRGGLATAKGDKSLVAKPLM
jgi:hypothetical protein